MKDIRNAYNILVRITEGKRPIGIPIGRREDNVRMNVRGIWWEHCVLDSSGSG
jgi:hypothetical protein